jgi:RimJ/RimL family protein N-acetyltransferase
MKTRFKEGKIIEKFYIEKNGKKLEIVIRFPAKKDLNAIWMFYNKVIKETEFLSRITSVSKKEERKWLSNMLEGMRKNDKIYIVAEHNRKIIGSTSIERSEPEVRKHIGIYGISILQEYTGFGLGKKLTQIVLKLAKQIHIEIVCLSVYHKNKIATNLYKKLGFTYIGKLPKGVKRRTKYMDEILMYKVLK